MKDFSVCIVDDDTRYIEQVDQYCSELGLAFQGHRMWSSGLELELSEHHVLLLDLKMPGEDGLDVLFRLAKIKHSGPIVLMTSLDEVVLYASQKYAKFAGLNVYQVLHKPFTYHEFQAVLDSPVPLGSADVVEHSELSLTAIRECMQTNAFYVCYQPQVDIWKKQVVGAECLARLNHPVFGEVSPLDFIPLIEEYGIISEFTLYLFERSVLNFKKLWGEGHDLLMAFNISALSLNRDFCTALIDLVRSHDVAPHLITLEVKEASALGMSVDGLFAISKLRVTGFQLSIDDFGSGTATIKELHELPFVELKLDKMYANNLSQRGTSKAIISATSRLSQALNYRLVAEGVEDHEQIEFLSRQGCHLVQGFLFSKPLTIGELHAFLYNFNYQALVAPDRTPSAIQAHTRGQSIAFVSDETALAANLIEKISSFVVETIPTYSMDSYELCSGGHSHLALSEVDQLLICGDLEKNLLETLIQSRLTKQTFLIVSNLSREVLECALDLGVTDVFESVIYPEEIVKRLNHYQDYENKLSANSKMITEGNKVAFSAMKEASQYGQVLQYVKSIITVENRDQILDLTCCFFGEQGIPCAVQLRDGVSKYSKQFSVNECSSMILKTFSILEVQGKLFEFNRRLICNGDGVSILLLTLPGDEVELGKLKDVIATLVDVLDEKWKDLKSKVLLEKASGKLMGVSSAVSKTATILQEGNEKFLQRFAEEIHQSFHILDLSEEQENFLLNLIQSQLAALDMERELDNVDILVKELKALVQLGMNIHKSKERKDEPPGSNNEIELF